MVSILHLVFARQFLFLRYLVSDAKADHLVNPMDDEPLVHVQFRVHISDLIDHEGVTRSRDTNTIPFFVHR